MSQGDGSPSQSSSAVPLTIKTLRRLSLMADDRQAAAFQTYGNVDGTSVRRMSIVCPTSAPSEGWDAATSTYSEDCHDYHHSQSAPLPVIAVRRGPAQQRPPPPPGVSMHPPRTLGLPLLCLLRTATSSRLLPASPALTCGHAFVGGVAGPGQRGGAARQLGQDAAGLPGARAQPAAAGQRGEGLPGVCMGGGA